MGGRGAGGWQEGAVVAAGLPHHRQVRQPLLRPRLRQPGGPPSPRPRPSYQTRPNSPLLAMSSFCHLAAAPDTLAGQAVLPEAILRPETQDQHVFAEGVETIVSTNRRVAEAYIVDGRSDLRQPASAAPIADAGAREPVRVARLPRSRRRGHAFRYKADVRTAGPSPHGRFTVQPDSALSSGDLCSTEREADRRRKLP